VKAASRAGKVLDTKARIKQQPHSRHQQPNLQGKCTEKNKMRGITRTQMGEEAWARGIGAVEAGTNQGYTMVWSTKSIKKTIRGKAAGTGKAQPELRKEKWWMGTMDQNG
jgi:hypothetical protein